MVDKVNDINQQIGGTGRLIVVSNRVADPRRDRKAGGLAVAVGEALQATGGGWFGWSGEIRPDAEKIKPIFKQVDGVNIVTIDLTSDELAGYYHGYSNQCLWPLLHYRTDLVRFDRSFLQKYRTVNRRFATALAKFIGPDDMIWVQDLHLMPLGAEARRLKCKQPIGFFLHVPFPPPEVIATLPGHSDLMIDMMAYDLIGFQTQTDATCFRDYARRELGAEVLSDGSLQFGGRNVQCGAFPTGIDVDTFASLSRTTEAQRQIARLRDSVEDRALIVGVDRLDYSKGLAQRLTAYRRFLSAHPEFHKKVVLMQVTPPSRETVESYMQIRRELDRLEGAINGEFGELDWTPVRYLRRAVSRARLAALHRGSRVGLVTPLRDGMNLVAKEYVAAQDEEDPGVLILSQFAGAAEAMDEALIVNPYDTDGVADALHKAMRMPLKERRARHQALLGKIRAQDVHAWSAAFLSRLANIQTSREGELPGARSDLPRRPAGANKTAKEAS